MRFPETIDKKEIVHLPLLRFGGQIEIVNNKKDLLKALNHCADQIHIGFDTEKKPTFEKGQYHATAMVQLATPGTVYLIRLNQFGFRDPLRDFFEDGMLKIGISIKDDLQELQMIREFSPQNFMDLNAITNDIGIKSNGVRNLAAIVLNKRISKNQQISNWESEELTQAQQVYAATDAWVCIEIYRKLMDTGVIESW